MKRPPHGKRSRATRVNGRERRTEGRDLSQWHLLNRLTVDGWRLTVDGQRKRLFLAVNGQLSTVNRQLMERR